jgi:hypothetical protein
MSPKDIEREIASLPPEARKQVADFIAFLRGRRGPARPRRSGRRIGPLNKEPFIGMWKGRADMRDSVDWVRVRREEEWHAEDE